MAKTKRIEWVDIGKFICIMFVMLSHLESGSDILDTFYKPFYLTVFFFFQVMCIGNQPLLKNILSKR